MASDEEKSALARTLGAIADARSIGEAREVIGAGQIPQRVRERFNAWRAEQDPDGTAFDVFDCAFAWVSALGASAGTALAFAEECRDEAESEHHAWNASLAELGRRLRVGERVRALRGFTFASWSSTRPNVVIPAGMLGTVSRIVDDGSEHLDGSYVIKWDNGANVESNATYLALPLPEGM